MLKHYAKPIFAAAILKCIPFTPDHVLDPAVGGGNLLAAARDQWNSCKLTGIDISSRAIEMAAANVPEAKLLCHDALKAQWFKKDQPGRMLIACNPPFTGQAPLPMPRRTDLQFLQKCLLNARSRDAVLFILPGPLASSRSFEEFRSSLLKSHSLLAAISLPSNAFEETEAYAVGLVIKPWSPNHASRTEFISIGSNGKVIHRVRQHLDSISYRFDPQYYITAKWLPPITSQTIPLKNIIRDLSRGTFVRRTASKAARGHRFLHTTDLGSGWIADNASRYVHGQARNVFEGSILQSRVGRNLWRKSSVFNSKEHMTASDCIWIARPNEMQESGYIGAAMTTTYVQITLHSRVIQLTVPVLRRDDLLELPVPWIDQHSRNRIGNAWLTAKRPSDRIKITRLLNQILIS